MKKEHFWGAQTELATRHFKISREKMPEEIINAYALIKKASAKANEALGLLESEKAAAVCDGADKILQGKLKDEFPLPVWQTGSGTGTNMNVNEVIANYENHILNKNLLHPNDDVNMSQSSNDTFPSAIHIAALTLITGRVLPCLKNLITALKELESKNEKIIKTGRTHLQDAVPLKFSQEISGWRAALEQDEKMIYSAADYLRALAQGGTAVGTGINCPDGFREQFLHFLNLETGENFRAPDNSFAALTSRSAPVFAHSALKALAADLMKVANDIRFLASGPRCGYGEISIPFNEKGSSIMPGKVNPTQCEQVTLAAVQVMGNDAAIGFAASQGNFELNVYAPVIACNLLQSARLLADSMEMFTLYCVKGIKPNEAKMRENLNKSLMLVTALNTEIGYDKAGEIAREAYESGLTLKEVCLKNKVMSEERFDELTNPEKLI